MTHTDILLHRQQITKEFASVEASIALAEKQLAALRQRLLVLAAADAVLDLVPQ